MCGTRAPTARPTWSRSTSGTCAARWAGTSWRPYGAPDTGSPVAADRPRFWARLSLRARLILLGAGGPPDDPQTVVVARPLSTVHESIAVVRDALLIPYPLIILVLVLLARRVVGAALRPVEELRVGAERIRGEGRTDRLPVPRTEDEIHRLAVTLNDMLDRLAAARARQRAFVADAAHELRSPLTN